MKNSIIKFIYKLYRVPSSRIKNIIILINKINFKIKNK